MTSIDEEPKHDLGDLSIDVGGLDDLKTSFNTKVDGELYSLRSPLTVKRESAMNGMSGEGGAKGRPEVQRKRAPGREWEGGDLMRKLNQRSPTVAAAPSAKGRLFSTKRREERRMAYT